MTHHRFSAQAAAVALATILTLAMLGSVDRLATSQPPAGLVAQMAKAPSNA